MKSPSSRSIVLFIIGELLLIFSFIHFGEETSRETLTLHIIISSIIFFLLFTDIFAPWINNDVNEEGSIGSMGLRWVFTTIYILLAIATMVFLNAFTSIEFTTQLLIHGILLFLLAIGLFMGSTLGNTIEQVQNEERIYRSSIEDMKKSSQSVLIHIQKNRMDIPQLHNQLERLITELRYLSPSKNPEARGLENQFLLEMDSIRRMTELEQIQEVQLLQLLSNAEITLQQRKNITSK